MSNSGKEVIKILIKKGNELLKQHYKKIEFTKNSKADNLLNNLTDFPHAFVLACVMDRQIKAERAWLIPYKIYKEISTFEFNKLLELTLDNLKEIFKRKNLHRFNEKMSKNFCFAIQKIHKDYKNNASNIWKNNQSSATIVRRFLEFKGVGIKIATMATNMLARDFKIPMKDHICIDISPDVHVKRVFKRLGLISKDASNDELIYRAKELNPLYPGIFDLPCWEIGRNWCKSTKPICKACYLNGYCYKETV